VEERDLRPAHIADSSASLNAGPGP
jgi:hypothetical protein